MTDLATEFDWKLTTRISSTQDNEARDTRICLIHDDFKAAIVGGDGFVWANDQADDHTAKVSRACPFHDSYPEFQPAFICWIRWATIVY